MIPKIIHYCWFGNKPIPTEQVEFIDEWKLLHPDYKFKCWSEKDIEINSYPFAKEAYEAGKLAFVADFVRVYAICREGGIYLDTDVKLLSTLEPFRIKHRMFTSYQYNVARSDMELYHSRITDTWDRKDKNILKVPGNGMLSALFGCEAHHPFIEDLLNYYNSIHFDYAVKNKLTIPTTMALIGEKYGFKYHNVDQDLKEGIHIYDTSVFSDFHNKTSKSVSIHYCEGSWVEKTLMQRIKGKLYRIDWLRTFINKVWSK